MQQHRHRNVVRQIGDESRWLTVDLGSLDSQRVGGDDGEVADSLRGVAGDRRREQLGQPRIDLDGGDLRRHFEQGEGQRSEPRSDLEHVTGGIKVGQGRDLADGVGVVHEVLAQLLVGRRSNSAASLRISMAPSKLTCGLSSLTTTILTRAQGRNRPIG